jgi:hypothetical protein
MYSRNIEKLLLHLYRNETGALDPSDEITRAIIVTRDGEVLDSQQLIHAVPPPLLIMARLRGPDRLTGGTGTGFMGTGSVRLTTCPNVAPLFSVTV